MPGPPYRWNPDARYVTADGEPPPPPPPYTGPSAPEPLILPGPPAAFMPIFPGFMHFQPGLPPAPPPPEPPAAPAPPPQPPQQPLFPPGLLPEAPGQGMPPGINYLYPPKHTMLHVILNGVLPYETPVQDMRFKIFLAPCNVTVKQLISLLGAGEGADDKCGVTECVELGYGRWGKGISVFRADGAKCDQTLEDIGWDAERGDTKKPVWLAVHKP